MIGCISFGAASTPWLVPVSAQIQKVNQTVSIAAAPTIQRMSFSPPSRNHRAIHPE